jgi:hypothetical protein
MAETDRYLFDYKEVAEALVKQQGLHEGLWGVSVEFGLAAQNLPTSPDGKTVLPAAIVPIQRIGLNRWKEPNNLTVDAAEVNPAPRLKLELEGRRVKSVKSVKTNQKTKK